MMELLFVNNFEKISKGKIVAQFKILSLYFGGRMVETKQNLCQDSRCCDQDSNHVFPVSTLLARSHCILPKHVSIKTFFLLFRYILNKCIDILCSSFIAMIMPNL
jgi:hypothetical protein